MSCYQKIYFLVSKIPKGKVVTYKQIADILKIKNPRVVGFALHVNKNPKKVPCHRIIKSNGTLAKGYAFGGKEKQKEKLEKEGILFLENGIIDLKKYLYKFS